MSMNQSVTYVSELDRWPGTFPGEYQSFYSMIRGGWFLMEVITLLFTSISLYFFRAALLTVILYIILLFMGMDVLSFFVSSHSKGLTMGTIRTWISIGLGSVIIGFSLFQDLKNRCDFAFWGYLIGAIAFWFGITFDLFFTTEFGKFFYCALNFLLLLFGAIVNRRVFIVFGVLGILTYLMELAFRKFLKSSAFPVMLSFIGILIIVLGLLIQKYSHKVGFFKVLKKYSGRNVQKS